MASVPWGMTRSGYDPMVSVDVSARDCVALRDDRGCDRRHPVRKVRDRRRRCGSRERGRPHDRGPVRHARLRELHGDARSWPRLPLLDRRAVRRARAAADDRPQRDSTRNGVHRLDRSAEGVSTGISAHDRARTIQVAIDPGSTLHDLVQPGHVFPLRARPGGVLRRAGQTEAAVDLARLAGLIPAGVVCEIMNDDGTMAGSQTSPRSASATGSRW